MDVTRHPDSEKLYIEQIDIGGGEMRQILSGLQKAMPIERLQGADVICILNLKSKNLAKTPSHGMVLCGEYADGSVIELLEPPAGSKPGDQISFAGFERVPLPQLKDTTLKDADNKKFKQTAWDRVIGTLKVSAEGVACIGDIPFSHPLGNVTVPTVRNGIIK